jgi:hypothetical protein
MQVVKPAAGYFSEVVVAFKSINLHNPSEVLGEFQEAGPYDVEIAREAFYEWRVVSYQAFVPNVGARPYRAKH